MVDVVGLGFSVVETKLVGLFVVVTVPLPWGVVVVMMFLLLEMLVEEDVGLVVVTVPVLDTVVVVLMLLDVIDEEEVGLGDVLVEPVLLETVLLAKVGVLLFEVEEELALVLKLVETEEEL